LLLSFCLLSSIALITLISITGNNTRGTAEGLAGRRNQRVEVAGLWDADHV
jgi:hypothetical protein